MTVDDLRNALEGLSRERVERLVDVLERDPEIEVTVGAWRPQCPMVLTGFDPLSEPPITAEQRFAATWDRFARAEPRRQWLAAFKLSSGRAARRVDVQTLLRTANEVLATPRASTTTLRRSGEERDRQRSIGQGYGRTTHGPSGLRDRRPRATRDSG